MKEVFVLNGKWWTPTTPDEAIIGEMTFDPSKGAILKLSGMFNDRETCAMPFEIVLGETEDGRAITLIGSSGIWLAHPYRIADADVDVPTCSSLCANVLLIGGHYLSSEEIGFKSFTIDLLHLSNWAGCNDPRGTDLSRPDAVAKVYDIGRFGKLTIGSENNSSCHLTITLDSEVSLDEGIELVRQLRNLMTLLMHRPVQEIRVRGTIGNATNDIGPCKMIDILYPSFTNDRSINPPEPDDMLLPLGSIGAELGGIVANWLLASETMTQVLDLYLAASQSAELFPETRFLMYVQAIEAYHRLRYRNFEVDPEEHSKRLAIILSSIPEQYREWMRDGLEYSNEPSNSQRLREIYRDLRDIMDEFVDEGKLFIFQVVKTRNHLMHSEGDSMILDGNDLVLATMRLRLLLELCLLKEIGIGEKQMKQAVINNTMFSKIRIQPADSNDK